MVRSLVALLQERGHRITPSREALLRVIAGRRGHFTAAGVGQEVPGVGRATVYRTLRLLVELGAVCRVLLEDGSLHYRLSLPGHHHHLVCLGCGSVREFTDRAVEELVARLVRGTRYQMQGHWLEIYGRCEACQVVAAGGL